MALRVHLPDGSVDRWDSAADERHWFDHTHQVSGDELLVFLHTFRRVRDRHDRRHDRLLWKHHTTKLAHRYPEATWTRVSDAVDRPPPTRVELVPRVRYARSRADRR